MKKILRIKRKEEMQVMHRDMLAKGVRRMEIIYSIAFKYNLSIEQTYRILKSPPAP